MPATLFLFENINNYLTFDRDIAWYSNTLFLSLAVTPSNIEKTVKFLPPTKTPNCKWGKIKFGKKQTCSGLDLPALRISKDIWQIA